MSLSEPHRVLHRLARVRVTVIYALALLAVSITLMVLGPLVADRVVRHASTNLHNLSHGHVGTLLGSAFVVDAGPVWVWLPALMCLLALCEVMFGSIRLIVAFAVGHIGATLLVAIGLATAVRAGWIEAGSVTRAVDVGMSYGAAAVLGGLTAAIPPRWRWVWLGAWVGLAVSAVLVDRDFTDVGHAIAFVLGAAVSTRFGPARRWTVPRVIMLAVAVGFSALMLANSPAAVHAALFGGPAGVLIGAGLALWFRQRNSSELASIQSERQDSGTGSSINSPGISHSNSSA